MTENTTSRDDKLLKRESYIRRERYVAFSLAVGGILVVIAKATHTISAEGLYPMLGCVLFSLVYADSCNLRLRHIQSIKFYRGTTTHDISAYRTCMKAIPESKPATKSSSLRRFLLERAFQNLLLFTALFLLTCLPIPSASPSQISLLPARIAFVMGATTWILTFLLCVHAFGIPAERPAILASFSFFLILGIELQIVAHAALLL